MGFAPTWLRQVSPPPASQNDKTTLTTDRDSPRLHLYSLSAVYFIPVLQLCSIVFYLLPYGVIDHDSNVRCVWHLLCNKGATDYKFLSAHRY